MSVSVSMQEKAMGNRPSEMMDREKAYIPELQISFMEHIAMPIYKCVQNKVNTPLCLWASDCPQSSHFSVHEALKHMTKNSSTWRLYLRSHASALLCPARLLSELFPGATELYERVAANREQWTKVSHKFTIRGLPSNNSLDFLDQEYELLQSQGAFGSDDQCLNGCLEDAEGGRGQWQQQAADGFLTFSVV